MRSPMFTGKITGIVMFVIRLALGLIFLYSGLGKIVHPYDFLASVYDFELTGPYLNQLVAMALPWLELLLAFALLLNLFSGGALLGCALLGTLFVGVQASAIWRGLSVNCGCFGPDEAKLIGLVTFTRTCAIAMVAFGGWLIYLGKRQNTRMPALK